MPPVFASALLCRPDKNAPDFRTYDVPDFFDPSPLLRGPAASL